MSIKADMAIVSILRNITLYKVCPVKGTVLTIPWLRTSSVS